MGGGMQAVRPQLLAQEPSRRLSAGQVEAYLYIWPVLATRAASPVRNPSHEMHDSLASVLLALGRWQRARRVLRLSDAQGRCVARKDSTGALLPMSGREWCKYLKDMP